MATILFFAQARDATSSDSADWPISEAQSEEALWKWLITRFPRLAPLRQTCRIARNGSYLAAGEQLQPGDEVAIIPPVSGG